MASKQWRPRRRVLVVDDDPDIRLFLCDMLAHWRYEPLQAASGWEALEVLQCSRVDVVLLDLVMPTMDGLDTLHEIKRHYRDLPVIMMSALMTPQLGRELLAEGAQDWMEKPVRREALSVALLSVPTLSGRADHSTTGSGDA
ncbi:response regulator [Nitrospira moscoviensis]|nr:response regulator [Nitrospira moscoviensis]